MPIDMSLIKIFCAVLQNIVCTVKVLWLINVVEDGV